jgi:hypothetical protein
MYSALRACPILTKLEFSQQIFIKSNFMKIHPVAAQVFHADGWMDMAKQWLFFAIKQMRLKPARDQTIPSHSSYGAQQVFVQAASQSLPHTL